MPSPALPWRLALSAATAALMPCALAAAPACPGPPPQRLVERFVPADCTGCWAGGAAAAAGSLAIDWIVPAGADAPMAAAALAEAQARSGRAATRVHALPGRARYALSVSDGIPLQGYIGLSLSVHTQLERPPAGLVGYVALVERLEAGDEGSAVPRRLVRALAGPLNLSELSRRRPSLHTLATRAPDTPRIDRLASVGWIEDARGTVLAAVEAVPPACRPRRE